MSNFQNKNDNSSERNSGEIKIRSSWSNTSSIAQELQVSYMRQVSTFPILTKEEEYSWAKQYSTSKEALFELLRRFPGLLRAVFLNLGNGQTQLRFNNFFYMEDNLPDSDGEGNVKSLFYEALERVSALPEDVFTYTGISMDEKHKPFWSAIQPLILRANFYNFCLDQLNIPGERGKYISDEVWTEIHPVISKLTEDMKSALTVLVERNLRLVISIASHYMGTAIPLADLVQEGNMGLMRSVERYDYSRKHHFSTYASYWIRQAITKYITNHSRIIRMPANTVAQISAIKQAEQKHLNQHGELPTLDELSKMTNLSAVKIRALQKMTQQPLSLQSLLDDDTRLEDTIPDTDSKKPNETADIENLHESLRKLLGTLDEREQKILKMRFGLDDGDCLTLAEISQVMGLSSERIRQIESAALHKLRMPGALAILEGYK